MANVYVHTIGLDEMKNKCKDRNNVEIVNVLSPGKYGLGSIVGSKRIPLAELAHRSGEIDKSKEVIVYCAGPSCDASHKAAVILAEMGFKVDAFEGGIEAWKKAGLPLTGASQPESDKPEFRPDHTLKDNAMDGGDSDAPKGCC